MLKHTDEFKNAIIVRSRDPAILNELDVLVDVGGEYNHDRRRYGNTTFYSSSFFGIAPD